MDAGGVGSSASTSTLTSSSVSASSGEHPATSRARFDWCFGMSEDHREPGKNGWSWVRIPAPKKIFIIKNGLYGFLEIGLLQNVPKRQNSSSLSQIVVLGLNGN